MIEFSAEIAPDWNTVSYFPPRCQCQADHVKHAQQRCDADIKTEK